MAVDDYLTCNVYQDSGGALDAKSCQFTMIKVAD